MQIHGLVQWSLHSKTHMTVDLQLNIISGLKLVIANPGFSYSPSPYYPAPRPASNYLRRDKVI